MTSAISSCPPPKRWHGSTRKLSAQAIAKDAVRRVSQQGVIAEFTGTMTTPDLDRDGDVLHSAGASPDPAMPLLWAHDAGKPIGKLIEVVSHTDDALVGRFAIADTPLGRDAVALAEIGALRLSIGFQPDEYQARKNAKGEHTGWDVTKFRVWETSVVGVPSNESAVILSLQRGELKTPEAIAWAKQFSPSASSAPAGQAVATVRPEDVPTDFDKCVQLAVEREMQKEREKMKANATGRPTADEVIAGAPTNAERIRVKAPSEMFCKTRKTVELNRYGLPARGVGGTAVEEPSEWDAACFGVFMKHVARRSGIPLSWDDSHRAIMSEMINTMKWCGDAMGTYHAEIEPDRVKTLLDDDVSYGSAINPVYFDDMLIVKALLSGELFPLVELVNLPRGSSVSTATMERPTMVWGTAEGTAADTFDTADLLAPLSSTVRNCTCFVEIGLDFMQDSAITVGNMLSRLIGERMQAELDRVVAVGQTANGEPLGIFETSGITSVVTSTSSAGPVTIGDIDGLIFAVDKAERTKANRCRFVMADTQYRHCRDIPLGSGTALSYNQRVFDQAMNNSQSYTLYEWQVAIQQDIPAGSMAFCALGRYRMYRRLGLTLKWTDQGKTLTLSNTALLSVRSRWAGQLTLPECCAIMTGVGTHLE